MAEVFVNIIQYNNSFITDSCGPYHKHNHTTQDHKKWLATEHYRISVCTRPTRIRAKHFNSALTV